MSIPEVISGIIAQKNSLGMTNQQIADTAKVSKATVDRLLRGDPAAGPSAQTLFDIAAAVGCRCDISPPPDADNGKDDSSEAAPNTAGLSTAQICALYDAQRARLFSQYDAQRVQLCAQFNRMLAVQHRWLRFTVTLILVLFFILIAMLAYDAANPSIGWLR